MNKETRIINGNNQENFSNFKKIINGNLVKNTNKKKYNFFCSICDKYSYTPLAAGAYIGKNIVVTAAHVVYGLKSNSINIRFGKKNLYHRGLKFDINKILIHPDYNNTTTDNDIALIFLDNKPSRYGINIIYLPSNKLSQKIYKINNECIILGYGTNSFFFWNTDKLFTKSWIKNYG